MRKIFLFMHVSLDGYFEGPGHDFGSWVTAEMDPFEAERGPGQSGTILLGRRTYDLMKGYWPTPEAKEAEPEIARYMNDSPKLVVSHEPFDPGWSHVTVISGDVIGQIRALREGSGDDIIIFGSNTLCVSLMEEGLLDEVQTMVNPIVLGAGTPLFQGLSKRVPLTLKEARTFPPGAVLLTYEVNR